MKTDKIRRLVALKTETINQLRQDLYQLKQLLADSRSQYELIVAEARNYADAIAMQESSGELLAIAMMERRRFLNSMHQQISQQEKDLAEVEQQYEYALNNLKQAYMEIKTLDLLAERKLTLDQIQDNRKLFKMADDEHSVRYVNVVE